MNDHDLLVAARKLVAAVPAQNETVDRILGIDLANLEAASVNVSSPLSWRIRHAETQDYPARNA